MATQKTTKVTTVTTTVTSVALDNIAEASAACARYAEIKDIIKALENEKALLDGTIRDWMGDATIGTIGGVVRAEIKARSRKGIDMKDLQEVFPEAYELCLKTTDYTFLDAE